MSSAKDHIDLANRNQSALEYLLKDPPRCAEIIAVTAFYKAVHVAEALFDLDSRFHSHSHTTREDRLKNNSRYKHCWKHYRVLKSASLVARYLSVNATGLNVSTFESYMPATSIQQTLLDGRLKRFEAAVVPLFPPNHGLVLYQ